jgi:methylamine dehydrogenase accessory protein MauD
MALVILISHIALWVLVFGLAFLLLGSLRSTGMLNWRLAQLEATTPSRIGRNGLKPGTMAPHFTLPSVAGGEVSLGDFAGHKVLLVFVQSGCGPCHDIAPELNRLTARSSHARVLVVNNAEPEQAREFAHEVRAQFPVLVQDKWSVSKRYQVFATPFAFLIDRHGVVIAKGIVGSKEHLGYLLSSATSQTAVTDDATNQSPVEKNGRTEENGAVRGELGVSVSLPTKEVHHV